MKRVVIAVIGVLLVFVVVYGYTWISSYSRSLAYLEAARTELAKGDVALAIKGGEVLDATGGAYVTEGGLQSVIEAWESPWAIPRPALYGQAVDLLNEAIDMKLDAASGLALVKQYARMDRRFLDAVLFKVASIYQEQGDADDARELFLEAKDLFPQETAFVARVDERLAQLDSAGTTK